VLSKRAKLPYGDPVALDRIFLGEVGAHVLDKGARDSRREFKGLHGALVSGRLISRSPKVERSCRSVGGGDELVLDGLSCLENPIMANGVVKAFTRVDPPKPGDPPTVIGVTVYVNLPKGEQPTGHRLDRERWTNDEYIVFLDKSYPNHFEKVKVWELSILRHDGQLAHDWRDLQAIKTMLVGPEFEAMELYPAESRVIDVANETHLFVVVADDGKPVRIQTGRYGRREVSLLKGQRLLAR
jgi:hypothetical protein